MQTFDKCTRGSQHGCSSNVMSCDFVIAHGNKYQLDTVVHLSFSFDQLAMSSNCKRQLQNWMRSFIPWSGKKLSNLVFTLFIARHLWDSEIDQRESTTCLSRWEDILCRYSHILVTFRKLVLKKGWEKACLDNFMPWSVSKGSELSDRLWLHWAEILSYREQEDDE